MIDVSPDRFFALAQEALAELPAELASRLDNVALFIDDDAPQDDPGLLGYYDGIPQTERDSTYGGVLPDRIVLCRLPILDLCDTQADVVREVRITVAHEIAHHFGIDDQELHRLGFA